MRLTTRTLFTILGLWICTQSSARNYSIDFKFELDNTAIQLNKGQFSKTLNDTVRIELLKFYVSKIVLTYENGTLYKEHPSYHLVNLEDPASTQILLNGIPEGKIKSIDYLIGTDSLTNVSGSMEGDLDPIKGMYWAWRSGYVNFKIEGKMNSLSTRKHKFVLHVGGYLPPYKTRRVVSSALINDSMQQGTTFTFALEKILSDINNNPTLMMPGPKASKMANVVLQSIEVE